MDAKYEALAVVCGLVLTGEKTKSCCWIKGVDRPQALLAIRRGEFL